MLISQRIDRNVYLNVAAQFKKEVTKEHVIILFYFQNRLFLTSSQ